MEEQKGEQFSQNQHPKEGKSSLKETVVFSWRAPARPFKKRDKEFFTTVAALAFLVGAIFFFIDGLLPVAVVAALVFLIYVLATIAPEEVENTITNRGITFAGRKYRWDELVRFWFTKRFGNELLVIETVQIPNRIEMVIQEADKEKIKEAFEDFLPHEEASPNFFDKAAFWLSKRVPLEN